MSDGRWVGDKFIELPPLAKKQETAVADVGGAVAGVVAAVADTEVSAGNIPAKNIPREIASDATSIAGDTASEADLDAGDSAVAAVSQSQRRAPTALTDGDTERHLHGKYNNEPEVGNCGLFFGNWGTRGTVAGTQEFITVKNCARNTTVCVLYIMLVHKYSVVPHKNPCVFEQGRKELG